MGKSTIPTAGTTTATPEQRAGFVSALRVKGDRYGHAAIAGLAHELAIRFNGTTMEPGAQAYLVEHTGYDKGNVSRIAKVIRTDAKARAAAKRLNVMTIDDTSATLAAAVKIGEMFKRQPKASAPATPDTEPAAGEGDEPIVETATGATTPTAASATDLSMFIYDSVLAAVQRGESLEVWETAIADALASVNAATAELVSA